jgi:uncharacterized protein
VHWDFALILLLLATVVPLLGRRRVRKLIAAPSTTKIDRLVLYASTIAFQWIAVAVILWRTRAHNIALAALGAAIPRPGVALVSAVMLSALILVNQIVALRRLADHPDSAHGILPHLALKVFPQDAVERLGFTALVATVAICEELIYRGFAQRVFEDLAMSFSSAAMAAIVGVIAAAGMFSLAHLYQGRRGLITTFIVGVLFSIIRAYSGSLAPGCVAHFVADITAGFLAPARLKAAAAKSSLEPLAPNV